MPVPVLCFILAAVILSWPVAAGGQVVRGHVIDAESGKPIPLASIELLDNRQKPLVRGVADSTGAFRLRAWLPGKYQVRISVVSYQTITSHVLELGSGEEFDISVRLPSQPIPVEPITVVAHSVASLTQTALRGYYDRRDYGRRVGIGRFLDGGEIDRRGTKLTDVLRKVPGLRVFQTGGCLVITASSNPTGTNRLDRPRPARSSSCAPREICLADIFLDGMALRIDQVPLDQTVPLDWIEAIEVYRRPSEVPAEFLGSGACGVVALWTRRE